MATSNCAPCADCPPTPTPVMPRCDIVLPDGTFLNATLIVENGCIVEVQAGSAPLYAPEPCCPDTGGGGGGEGLDGPPGPPGANATITIGSVTSVAYGQPATVTNSGTPTNAILDFEIPRGEDGSDGAGGSGLTTSAGGIEFVNGLLQSVPVQWPPIMLINVNPVTTPGVTLTATKDPSTGIVTMELDMTDFVTALEEGWQATIDGINTVLAAMETQIISLQEQLLICCPASVLDMDGDGSDDPGGTPGISPPPPVDPN